MRALNDLEAGLIAGVPDDDRHTVRDLLVHRFTCDLRGPPEA
jgi:hypothetical protein